MISIVPSLQLLAKKKLCNEDIKIIDSYEMISSELERKEQVYDRQCKEEAIRIIDKICRRTFLQLLHYPFYNTANLYYMLGRHINRLRRKYCILNNPDDYRVEKSHLIWGIMSVFNLFIKDTSIIDLCETILFIGDYTYIRKVQVRQLIHFAFYSIYSLEEQDEIYNFVTGVTSSVQIGACIFSIQHGELVVNSEMVWVFTLPYIVNSPETDRICASLTIMFILTEYKKQHTFGFILRQVEYLSARKKYEFFSIFTKEQLGGMIDQL